jgi:nucleoside-diphosphate-sugar epimerase
MESSIVKDDLEYIINSNLNWSEFDNKTILITGANGMLASYMVKTLLYLNKNRFKNKCKVIALVRNAEKAKLKFNDYIQDSGLELVVQDICDKIEINGKIDYIVHAASQASPKYYGKDPVGTLNANVLGTNNILRLAYEKRAKSVLFFSSGDVYGKVSQDKIPIKENDYGFIDLSDVRSCYGESKRLAETMCVSWFKQYDVPVKMARIFHTYGPGMELNDGRVFADFVNDILNNRDIHLNSDGTATRAFCYISDATIGFFSLLLNGVNGEAYNLANDNCEISIIDLANLLVKLFPEKQLKVIKNLQGTDKNYIKSPIQRSCPSIEKIRKIGWNPNISIEDGFRKVILSYNK